jgi:hypothetical protein
MMVGRAEREPAEPLPECERLWTANEVSAFLGVPVTTLHQWRYLGQGTRRRSGWGVICGTTRRG